MCACHIGSAYLIVCSNQTLYTINSRKKTNISCLKKKWWKINSIWFVQVTQPTHKRTHSRPFNSRFSVSRACSLRSYLTIQFNVQICITSCCVNNFHAVCSSPCSSLRVNTASTRSLYLPLALSLYLALSLVLSHTLVFARILVW